jgi:diaminopimelate epimerase
VGADGLVALFSSDIANAKMKIFNADGSEAQMCGNAARCAAKLLYESNYVKKSHITIETLSGVRDIYLTIQNGKIEKISVDMGKVTLGDMFLYENMGEKFEMREMNIGNCHQVSFVPDVDYIDFNRLGTNFENNPRFEFGVNTEICEVIGENHIKVRTYERGVGETLACGTGACVSAVAGMVMGACLPSRQIRVTMKGGDLFVFCDEMMRVRLMGDAFRVYDGVAEVKCNL